MAVIRRPLDPFHDVEINYMNLFAVLGGFQDGLVRDEMREFYVRGDFLKAAEASRMAWFARKKKSS